MRIEQHNNIYSIVDNGITILSASSVDELYKKALELMHVFSYPVHYPVVTPEESKLALDLLTDHISVDLP